MLTCVCVVSAKLASRNLCIGFPAQRRQRFATHQRGRKSDIYRHARAHRKSFLYVPREIPSPVVPCVSPLNHAPVGRISERSPRTTVSAFIHSFVRSFIRIHRSCVHVCNIVITEDQHRHDTDLKRRKRQRAYSSRN